jgi:hypothetical protein
MDFGPDVQVVWFGGLEGQCGEVKVPLFQFGVVATDALFGDKRLNGLGSLPCDRRARKGQQQAWSGQRHPHNAHASNYM